MFPAPYVDLVVAYREDQTSPALMQYLKVVGDVAASLNVALPEGAELI